MLLGSFDSHFAAVHELFKELMLLMERKLRNFSILKLNVTVNNQELGNQFHSFTAKTRLESFIKLLTFLICAFILTFYPTLKVEFRILMLPCNCSYHFLWHYVCSEN